MRSPNRGQLWYGGDHNPEQRPEETWAQDVSNDHYPLTEAGPGDRAPHSPRAVGPAARIAFPARVEASGMDLLTGAEWTGPATVEAHGAVALREVHG